MHSVIWWIRRDLRLDDNPTLRQALETGLPLLPVFILDPALQKPANHRRQNFLYAGLGKLDQSLKQHGSQLTIRSGIPTKVLTRMVMVHGTETIFAEEDYTPYAQKRDLSVAQALPLKLVTGLTAHHPSFITKSDGIPYTVFTPFSKVWKALPTPCGQPWQPPAHIPTPTDIQSESLPAYSEAPGYPAGEREAHTRLKGFIQDAIFHYHQHRDRMDLDGTSSLSPYLRFGMLSICRVLQAVEAARKAACTSSEQQGVETFLNELIWREFYHAILYHYPFVQNTAFNPKLRAITWREAPQDLAAWHSGQTGFPIVDAAMRQLAQTGWMHNRARMIVASFLTKDLLINWQEGEHWFMQQLLDGDLAANNGGWQWTAGVGTDAAPFFRIFNPTLQAIKFDPRGDYIRRWVPELAGVPDNYIHDPSQMNLMEQQEFGCLIGRDYPLPVVDRRMSRQRTLDAYQLSKTHSLED